MINCIIFSGNVQRFLESQTFFFLDFKDTKNLRITHNQDCDILF
jgi:hypothetical protein